MTLLMLATLIFTICYHVSYCNEITLSELLTNPPDDGYFSRFLPCSVSSSRMQDAYLMEGKLTAVILKGLKNVENKTKEKEYSEKDSGLKKAMENILKKRETDRSSYNFTQNPINALNFITRIVKDFNPILNSIFKSDKLMNRIFYKDLRAVIDRNIREGCSCWPNSNDIRIVARSISRILSFNNYPKKNLTDGHIYNSRASEPLSLEQAIALSQEANRNNYFEDVLDWVNFLLEDMKVSPEKDQLMWQGLLRIKAGAFFKRNKIQDAIDILHLAIKESKTDSIILKRDLKFYESKKEETSTQETANDQIQFSKDYADLCRNNSFPYKDIGLRCYFHQIGTLWDRVKVEMLSRNPPVFKYYKIIKDNEIANLFELMKSLKIKMSAHHEKGLITTDTNYSREAAVVWDDDHPITRSLSQRITYLTGLNVKTYKYNPMMSASSPFQITNYGIGGYVDVHTDYLGNEKDGKRKEFSAFGGDRMATWMYHLSENVQGGQLVFVKSNLSVSLEKGSGILMFNLFKNGTVNPLSEYMECPVILGSKWMGTKYIHEDSNMFKRKCPRIKRAFF